MIACNHRGCHLTDQYKRCSPVFLGLVNGNHETSCGGKETSDLNRPCKSLYHQGQECLWAIWGFCPCISWILPLLPEPNGFNPAVLKLRLNSSMHRWSDEQGSCSKLSVIAGSMSRHNTGAQRMQPGGVWKPRDGSYCSGPWQLVVNPMLNYRGWIKPIENFLPTYCPKLYPPALLNWDLWAEIFWFAFHLKAGIFSMLVMLGWGLVLCLGYLHPI